MSRKNGGYDASFSSESLFERIRESCRRVAENAGQVRINSGKIYDYAISLPLETIKTPELDPDRHYLDRGEGTLSYFLVLDSINFGSGYFPRLRKRPGMSGYFTIASALNDYFIHEGPMDCRFLSSLSKADCARIFGQNSDDEVVGELMELFAEALNNLGDYVTEQFAGSFPNLVNAAGKSCGKLAEILARMPFFADVQSYNGYEVYFFKRAQLTCADLALAYDGKSFGDFHDLDRLTIFADNLVPHVLRMDGILTYLPHLVQRIDAGKLISRGSREEIEIRACALHAVELVKGALLESGEKITSMGLDYLLWNRGQKPYYKRTRPRHRTRTVFY